MKRLHAYIWQEMIEVKAMERFYKLKCWYRDLIKEKQALIKVKVAQKNVLEKQA